MINTRWVIEVKDSMVSGEDEGEPGLYGPWTEPAARAVADIAERALGTGFSVNVFPLRRLSGLQIAEEWSYARETS